MTTPQRIEILGVPVDAVGMADTLAFAERQVAMGEGCATIVAVNPEKAMCARRDNALLSLLRAFFPNKVRRTIPWNGSAAWMAQCLILRRPTRFESKRGCCDWRTEIDQATNWPLSVPQSPRSIHPGAIGTRG